MGHKLKYRYGANLATLADFCPSSLCSGSSRTSPNCPSVTIIVVKFVSDPFQFVSKVTHFG